MMSRGRIAADSLMIDSAVVVRPASADFDAATGLLDTPVGTVVYSGRCRMRQPTTQELETMFGERQVITSRSVACLPHDAVGLLVGDVLTLTDTGDVDTSTRSFRITALPSATFMLYKGYPCEAVL